MKLGLGLYRRMLTTQNFRFAKQAGCTHIVAHLVDYFPEGKLHGTDNTRTWGVTQNQGRLWSEEELSDLKRAINAEGLELEAIENFDPSHWHDVLLDGPQREQQLEGLKTIIRRMGKVGIPVVGYNFSLAGVWAHREVPCARGGAIAVEFEALPEDQQPPIPHGQVWNMTYDPDAQTGNIGTVTEKQLWDRLSHFLNELVPVAEDSGVRLAAHPDDPPMPTLRHTARLVHQSRYYDRLLELVPSSANALEFCLGSLQEMTEGNVYEAVDHFSSLGKIAYIHFRNVRGKVPHYKEVFVDEGDLDMLKVLKILKKNNYQGVIIPDHTPQMDCAAPWHAGMAHALGYIRAAIQTLEETE
ncbi:mannonate dehydratase [Bythopirellula polymerisocia]|uniref:mannonate dehydratase n=1 Tax=Bythopirellula polymerisocia TaxID=2528003 RepID=A0A5C6CUQ0_9BACT|nr:mannonate dehydratase [Bythopirellula polymerisocia]TWU27575.1 Mannonate dehydratase [Bythopirellula polymerisocia]